MEGKAVSILEDQRTLAIAAVRPDGPTIVSYANDGLIIYFLISRNSQKLASIEDDDRVAVAIGDEPREFSLLRAARAGCLATEVTDDDQRSEAWRLLMQRHPNLRDFEMPDRSEAAMMRAVCKYISIVDYAQVPGHTDGRTVGTGIAVMDPTRTDDWGLSAVRRKRTKVSSK